MSTPLSGDARPTFDPQREERLRLILALDFGLGIPSGKTFDKDEMVTLHADLQAMIGEIDSLRSRVASLEADRDRLIYVLENSYQGIMLDANAACPAFREARDPYAPYYFLNSREEIDSARSGTPTTGETP